MFLRRFALFEIASEGQRRQEENYDQANPEVHSQLREPDPIPVSNRPLLELNRFGDNIWRGQRWRVELCNGLFAVPLRLAPRIKFRGEGEDTGTGGMSMPMDRQALVFFPQLNRPDVPAQMGSDFFPGVQTLVNRRHCGLTMLSSQVHDESR